MSKVKDLINEMDVTTFATLVKTVRPKNTLLGKESKGINAWPFGIVMNCMGIDIITAANNLIEKEFDISQEDILEAPATEYVSFLSFVRNQLESVSKLMKTLESEDPSNAKDVEELSKFGVIGIYYSIDPNPLSWDALANLPFVTMFMKMSLDNTVNKIKTKNQENELRKLNRGN